MEAITREEKIISGENLTPITRKEMFLAKASGQDVKTPEPITREEMFLSKISSEGSGSDSALPIEIATESEMTALLETAEIGAVYKFTGTSATYETDALYIVEEVESSIRNE